MTIFNSQRGNTILKQKPNDGQGRKRQWRQEFCFLNKNVKSKKTEKTMKNKAKLLYEKEEKIEKKV